MMELNTVPPFFADKQELVDEILGRYPHYGRRSAVMPLLWEVQRAERYVSEARVAEIAEILGITATEVKGVMSFYATYHGEPVGAYHLQVCSTLSCALAGSDELCDHLTETLGIVPGETDEEGRFSLQKVECLGSCVTAPVLQVNDTYYERVGRNRLDALIASMREGELPAPWPARSGDNEGPGAGPLGRDKVATRAGEAPSQGTSGMEPVPGAPPEGPDATREEGDA